MSCSLIATFIATLLGFWLLSCRDVFAWGAGIHIAQGDYVLNHLGLVLPVIADLLSKYSRDFLYGCISADIVIGKGSRRRVDHCHNWSVGQQLLSVAQEPCQKAFTYGYLAHLASDIIAHNFFIPNQLYRTSSTLKFGHVYWECRSDLFTERKHWRLARAVLTQNSTRNDDMMAAIVPTRLLSFRTNKQIYMNTIRLYDLQQWRQTVILVSRNSRWTLARDYVDFLKQLSLALVIDFLQHPHKARCLQYDPVGSDNIHEAKRKRRLVRRLNGKNPDDLFFVIPDELMEISLNTE